MAKSKDDKTSKLLIHEQPLQVLPGLAVALGLNEAIILQQLHYWLIRKPHSRDGRDWYYNTYEDWKKQFPFWSVSTIKRAIIHLEKFGVITAANYNHSPIDKTKWYAINYDVLNGLCDSTTAQNDLSTGQNEPSTDHYEPSTAQNDLSTGQNDTLHGSNCPHQYPEINSETTDRDLTPSVVSPPYERSVTNNYDAIFSPPSTRCPAGFVPDTSIRTWAAKDCPGVEYDKALEAFRDYEFGRTYTDWNARLKTWIRTEAKQGSNHQNKRRTNPEPDQATVEALIRAEEEHHRGSQ